MSDKSHNRRWRRLCLLCAGSLIVLAGCGPKNYKEDVDKRVYDIIDRKWDPQFGTKANYRISDIPPGPNDIRIENAVPASGLLTLPYALALATAHNREYQNQKDLLYTAALDLRLVRHGYETQLFGGGSAFYRHASDGAGAERTSDIVQTEANIGFNRLLATGTHVGTKVATAWADVLAGEGRSGLSSVFNAVITQPLLRGSDPRVVLEPLTRAERNTLYQIRAFNRFRKTFAVAVATQYFQALELHDITRNTQDYHDALAALHGQVAKLAAAGLIQGLEADQVRQDMLKARDALIVARRKYEQSLDEFKLTLALPMAAEFQMDVGLLDALRTQGLPPPELVLDEAVETALCQRLDMTNSADAVLDAQRAVYVAADRLRADLRLKAQVNVDTRGNRAVSAGPVLDLPLDRVPEQHVYRRALVSLEERRRDYDQLADTVRLEVRDAHRKLLATAERYQVASDGLGTAQMRSKKASVLMRYGQASSRRVLDALGDLYDVRNVASNAVVEYAVAILDFYRDTEALQVRPDGMWQEGPELPVTAVNTSAKTSTTAK
jgi:outer membrane protein TolC